MRLNDLLTNTNFENLEYSNIILYPEGSSSYMECTLCSDEKGLYFFTLNDDPNGERIYDTSQLPDMIEHIEFRLTFNVPTQEATK